VNLGLTLRMVRGQLDTDPEQARTLIDEAMEDLAHATSELRELARGIHPAVLSDGGLAPALRTLAKTSKLPVELEAAPRERFEQQIEAAAYFVVAEALTNVARYSGASSATVALTRDGDRLVVEVRDDGRGGADPQRGSGLRGLADRVAALDGTLELESPPGEGTVVRAVIPCG
jgi:signal transduction histidine kinase